MSPIHSIILGIVEGLTEFLPVSSTAHLLLAAKALNITETNFVKSFEIVIQLGAILAVALLYFKKIFSNFDLIKKVVVAFLPTAIIGFLLYKIFKAYLLNSHIAAWALIIGGLIMIAFEILNNNEAANDKDNNFENITYKQSFLIGLAQSLAIVPGVSRSGATILSGLALGIDRKLIVEFSFLLAIPTMLVASGYDVLKSGLDISQNLGALALGFITSFIVAFISVKFFLKFIKNHDFKSFGVYRIIIGVIFLLFYF
jgi:undecaprenyl-diphosphatase